MQNSDLFQTRPNARKDGFTRAEYALFVERMELAERIAREMLCWVSREFPIHSREVRAAQRIERALSKFRRDVLP